MKTLNWKTMRGTPVKRERASLIYQLHSILCCRGQYVSAVGDNNRGNNERRDTYALLKPGARSADIRERRHIESTGGSLRSEAITHSFFIDNSFMNKRLMLMLSLRICIPF